MRSFLLNALVGAALLGPAAAESSPVVETHNGYVRGTTSEYVPGVNVFKGIRYANAPVGEYRWAHPPHPDTWDGIKNVTTYPPECPQMSGGEGSVSGDEDCLFLNIYTPANFTTTSNYPVYFWIYGGRYSGGSASALTYEGSGLAAQGVVVVTVNYRLGALGFLAHPNLTADAGIPSGNWGFHDQIAALHWTNENIQNFGGNPSQITIGGQSAGAGSALTHVYSPLSAGLFQGAIAESGARDPHDPLTGSLASSHRNMSAALAQGITYLSELNVSTVAEARNLSVETILGTGSSQDTTFVGTGFDGNQAYMEPPLYRPVVDGYALPHTYAQLLSNCSQNDVPVLTGNNKDESGASAPAPSMNVSTYNSSNEALFEPLGLFGKFFDLFPAYTDDEAALQTNNYYRNTSLVSTMGWTKDWVAGGAKSDVYTYFWTHAPPGQSAGAFHGSELNYVFNNMPWGTTLGGDSLNWTSTDYAIAKTMTHYWVNFIKSGNPNGGNLPVWDPATQANSSKTAMHLGGPTWGPISVGSDEVVELIEGLFAAQKAY
ncbi:carboxylesterase [Diplodia corticola]|uniref:Carboxylic ester hydrolase n=1 Tax=Diplodia corticola TaxID=236234 RepID=A0A1J9RJA8_9PEZI|nr:carboxylesterase [Diplodia corticola]OJD40744.1 carboxylesterase [Diplodia corticola]